MNYKAMLAEPTAVLTALLTDLGDCYAPDMDASPIEAIKDLDRIIALTDNIGVVARSHRHTLTKGARS